MDQLRKQNTQLHEQANKYLNQLQQLRKIGQNQETKIQRLLKFNEKLLSIIEKEINGKKIKNNDMSLQPISQRTQLQSQIEMFQSQEKGKCSSSQKLMERKSNNFKSDSMSSCVELREPIAVLEKEEQLSIDVDGQKQGEEEEKNQIIDLIGQFRRSIRKNNKQFTLQDIEKIYKSQQQQLNQFKKQSMEVVNSRLQKLGKIKNQIIMLNVKDKIMGLLKQQKASNAVKNIIGSQLQQV